MFKKPLLLEHIVGTKLFRLHRSFKYKSIEVPKGYITDGGTKPWFSWVFVGTPYDEALECYVIHDFMCDNPDRWTRKEADDTFLEMMEELEDENGKKILSEAKRELMYRAVALMEKGSIEDLQEIKTIND